MTSAPEWERMAECERCGAADGQACLSLGHGIHAISRPHKGRRKMKVPYAPPRDRGAYTNIHDFVHMLARMVKAAGRKMRHADAEDLRELVSIRDELELAIRDGIDGLRGDGYSWKSIGEALGTTGQAAYMRYGKAKAG